MLTARTGLAKVSGTPERHVSSTTSASTTPGIWSTLPGYGYAPHVENTAQRVFETGITDYVIKCEKMHFLFVLADIRPTPVRSTCVHR